MDQIITNRDKIVNPEQIRQIEPSSRCICVQEGTSHGKLPISVQIEGVPADATSVWCTAFRDGRYVQPRITFNFDRKRSAEK